MSGFREIYFRRFLDYYLPPWATRIAFGAALEAEAATLLTNREAGRLHFQPLAAAQPSSLDALCIDYRDIPIHISELSGLFQTLAPGGVAICNFSGDTWDEERLASLCNGVGVELLYCGPVLRLIRPILRLQRLFSRRDFRPSPFVSRLLRLEARLLPLIRFNRGDDYFFVVTRPLHPGQREESCRRRFSILLPWSGSDRLELWTTFLASSALAGKAELLLLGAEDHESEIRAVAETLRRKSGAVSGGLSLRLVLLNERASASFAEILLAGMRHAAGRYLFFDYTALSAAAAGVQLPVRPDSMLDLLALHYSEEIRYKVSQIALIEQLDAPLLMLQSAALADLSEADYHDLRQRSVSRATGRRPRELLDRLADELSRRSDWRRLGVLLYRRGSFRHPAQPSGDRLRRVRDHLGELLRQVLVSSATVSLFVLITAVVALFSLESLFFPLLLLPFLLLAWFVRIEYLLTAVVVFTQRGWPLLLYFWLATRYLFIAAALPFALYSDGFQAVLLELRPTHWMLIFVGMALGHYLHFAGLKRGFSIIVKPTPFSRFSIPTEPL